MQEEKNQKERKADLGDSLNFSQDGVQLTVRQPEKIRSLLIVLSDLEKISETVSEDQSQDLGGGAATTAGDDDLVTSSVRGKAIQSLPSTSVMRGKLTKHLQREVRQLERKSRRLARFNKKGSAYLFNEIYARIRKLQALAAELVDAAADTVRRLYVRLFVDHQQLV